MLIKYYESARRLCRSVPFFFFKPRRNVFVVQNASHGIVSQPRKLHTWRNEFSFAKLAARRKPQRDRRRRQAAEKREGRKWHAFYISFPTDETLPSSVSKCLFAYLAISTTWTAFYSENVFSSFPPPSTIFFSSLLNPRIFNTYTIAALLAQRSIRVLVADNCGCSTHKTTAAKFAATRSVR